MAEFEYVSGGHSSGCAWRVYRSKTGLVGKVTRTKRGRNHGEWSTGKTRFFVWDKPDSAPEYETYGEALKAASTKAKAPVSSEAPEALDNNTHQKD